MNGIRRAATKDRQPASRRTGTCACLVAASALVVGLASASGAAVAQDTMQGMEMPAKPKPKATPAPKARKAAAAPAPKTANAMSGMEMPETPATPLATPPPASENPAPTQAMEPMPGMTADAENSPASAASQGPMPPAMEMEMGPMSGGRTPPDAREPSAYSDGYEYTGMPGVEKYDKIVYGMVLADEFEYVSGNEGKGFAWSAQVNYGGDDNKIWLRTQGLKIPGELDPTTSGELLWWRPYAPFWGIVLGVRQDVGRGAHTYLAAGIEGIAPNWFKVEATAYLGDDARLSARLKGSYELRFTNRLVLVPSVEANIYGKAENRRGLGSGLGSIEGGFRLRYEFHRKFAPYIGYVWERSFAGTADRRRAEGDPVNESRFVAGVRFWW